MVTCTIPYEIEGAFAGVATVDLKLSGLREYFAELAEELGGYVFAVDRVNTFPELPRNRDRGAIRAKSKRTATLLH